MTQKFDEVLIDALQRREMQIERRINYGRGAYLFAGGTLDMLTLPFARSAQGSDFPFPLIAAAFALLVWFLILIHRLTSGETYRPYLKYLTITIDYVSSFLFVKGIHELRLVEGYFSPATLGMESIPLSLFLLFLGALRYSRGAIVYSGCLSLAFVAWAAAFVAESFLMGIHGVFFVLITVVLIYANSASLRALFVGLFRRQQLARFLPQKIAEAIQRGEFSFALGGEEREVTLLLADIRNFTGVAERMSPTRVVTVLNRYLGEMSKSILEHGGMVDKFIGDAVLAVFGAPVSNEDDPDRAIRTARAILGRVDSLNREAGDSQLPPLSIGIALHTGVVVAGNVGSTHRMEYTVIGDAVNLTSRIEALNKEFGTRIIMSEHTHGRLSERSAFVFLGTRNVRGRSRPVELYGLRAEE